MKIAINVLLIIIIISLVIMIVPRFFNSDKKESAASKRRQEERTSGTMYKESQDEKKFKQEISSGSYHFFIFHSPLSLPLWFIGRHTWIVTVDHGMVNRRDIFRQAESGTTGNYRWHLHRNYYAPREWLEVFFWKDFLHRKGEIDYHIYGEEKSLAAQVVHFIEKNIINYPQRDRYKSIPWPNSNSITQRILDNFPEIWYKLSGKAIGKNYHSISQKKLTIPHE